MRERSARTMIDSIHAISLNRQDEEAWDNLAQAIRPTVRIATAQSRRACSLNDVQCELLSRLYESTNFSKFASAARFRSYVWIVVRRICLDLSQKPRAHQLSIARNEDRALPDHAATVRELVKRLAQKLSKPQFELVSLLIDSRFSKSESCKRLGISEAQYSVRLSRLKKKVIVLIKNHCE